jgi:hypothetical protein
MIASAPICRGLELDCLLHVLSVLGLTAETIDFPATVSVLNYLEVWLATDKREPHRHAVAGADRLEHVVD